MRALARNLGTLVEQDRYAIAVPDDTSGKVTAVTEEISVLEVESTRYAM